MNKIVLEKEALEVAKNSSVLPLIYMLPVKEGRDILENLQNSYVYKYPCTIDLTKVTTNYGTINVYIVKGNNSIEYKNIIFYIHGGGWTFGSFHTHEKLVRELAYRTNSILIFPEYTRSPEAKFPIAIEQCYTVLNEIPNILINNNINICSYNLIVGGDSVGGNMAIALSILSKYNGPKINKLLLYYPVTDDNFNNFSYQRFANDYYLYKDGMKWFWNNYEPNIKRRSNILATPLKANIEQLNNLPQTLIINGEADVLRDEGIAFANKLRQAGNDVTSIIFEGMIHDFVMLNSLDQTNACRAAMDISTDWINK